MNKSQQQEVLHRAVCELAERGYQIRLGPRVLRAVDDVPVQAHYREDGPEPGLCWRLGACEPFDWTDARSGAELAEAIEHHAKRRAQAGAA
jgi:hypothetical protein